MNNPAPAYRLDLLQQVLPFHRRARRSVLERGDLVYYGPMPTYYGVGEVVRWMEQMVVVNFRGTGLFGVHEELFEPQYLIPVPDASLPLL